MGKKSLNLNAALHQFPPGTMFTFSPDSLVERYGQKKWRAYEAKQGTHKIWLISPRALKKGTLRVHLRHSGRGYYLESS